MTSDAGTSSSVSDDAFITGLNDFGNFYIWFGIVAGIVFISRITVRELKYRKAIGMSETSAEAGKKGYIRPHLYCRDLWWYQVDPDVIRPMNPVQWLWRSLRLFCSGNKRQAPEDWEPYNWKGERMIAPADNKTDPGD